MARQSIQLTRLTLPSSRVLSDERLLILADVHEQCRNLEPDDLRALQPSAILIPGDFFEDETDSKGRQKALHLIEQLRAICPVYYSLGNHELGRRGNCSPIGVGVVGDSPLPEAVRALCRQLGECGVHVLCDRYVRHGSLLVGGLTSAGGAKLATDWLSDMTEEQGFSLLLCHHPEYYDRYLRGYNIDLTVSGHAHGGQWRLFGQGIYAPGQGLFPRYTSGFYHEQRLLVSRGIASRYPIPRIGNPKQMILLDIVADRAP